MATNNAHPTLVMKFGGTSVGTPQAMAQTIEIVSQHHAQWPHLVVVTSALSGVTNALLDSANLAAQGDAQKYLATANELRQKHLSIINALVPDPAERAAVEADIEAHIDIFTHLCQAIQVLGEASPRAMDAVASLGERMCVRVLAAGLRAAGKSAQFIESTELIQTDDVFVSANPNIEASTRATRSTLLPLLEQGIIPVVTGFLGRAPNGAVTTLGRGGSDYSAALLGAALPADEVWIWTDVDGVMTADPRLVPTARTIGVLSYREVSELAYFGAKVLHPKTIRPVIEAGIGLRVLNTFNPQHPGTTLVADLAKRDDRVVKAVTAIRSQRLVTVEGRGMLGVPGVAARTFGAVARIGISVPLITQASSEQSICFAVPTEYAPLVIQALETEFAQEIARRDIDRIWSTEEVVIVTVVGAGMSHTPGVAGQVFSSLGRAGVNVYAIAQGSSEVAISLVVSADDIQPAVQTLHQLIVAEA